MELEWEEVGRRAIKRSLELHAGPRSSLSLDVSAGVSQIHSPPLPPWPYRPSLPFSIPTLYSYSAVCLCFYTEKTCELIPLLLASLTSTISIPTLCTPTPLLSTPTRRTRCIVYTLRSVYFALLSLSSPAVYYRPSLHLGRLCDPLIDPLIVTSTLALLSPVDAVLPHPIPLLFPLLVHLFRSYSLLYSASTRYITKRRYTTCQVSVWSTG